MSIMKNHAWLSISLLFVALVAASPALSRQLPAPVGPVILTVTGNITSTTDGDVALFDRAMLEELGMTTVETTTPWTEGARRFEGVPVRRLLDAVGATGRSVFATALNDYAVEIPVSDFLQHKVILALKMDGAYLNVRDKGPIFVIYPFDAEPGLRNDVIYDRSIWQLSHFEVQ